MTQSAQISQKQDDFVAARKLGLMCGSYISYIKRERKNRRYRWVH